MKIEHEKMFVFLKEEILKAATEKADDIISFFNALNSARTVGDLRKIVEEFPVEVAIQAADAIVVYRQWVRLMEKNNGVYAVVVFSKLMQANTLRSQKRRCLI